MKLRLIACFGLVCLVGCGDAPAPKKVVVAPIAKGTPTDAPTLSQARKDFKTKLVKTNSKKEPFPEPNPEEFQLVKYDGPLGKYGAYLTPDPKDGQKHPAIIWITGGDCNSIDDGCWTPGPKDNNQSASEYRNAGIVMMFPSLRGGNTNPGKKEGFLGEVDDVIAAADYLAKQPYVDPQRIYLGGHSTGGTLVLLVAESTDKFRAIFSFGPADRVEGYGPEFCPFDRNNPKENDLRSPLGWLHGIKNPTFVFEGAIQGNAVCLQNMNGVNSNPKVNFFAVLGKNHFDLLSPVNKLIAERILKDNGPECNLTFSPIELNKLGD